MVIGLGHCECAASVSISVLIWQSSRVLLVMLVPLKASGSVTKSSDCCAHVLNTSDKNTLMTFSDYIILEVAFNSIGTGKEQPSVLSVTYLRVHHLPHLQELHS